VSSVDAEDEKLLAQLRAEVHSQAPPPVHTLLDDVVRRGRRRLRARRMAATLGVVAVVAGVGVTTAVLRDNLPGNQLVASPPTSVTSTTGLSGWSAAAPPSTSKRDSTDCSNGVTVPGEPKVDPVDVTALSGTLLKALTKAAPTANLRITRDTASNQPISSNSVLASTWADVIDSGGGGSVYVEVHGFSGTPAQAADSEQYVGGVCTAPQRKTLADGTIMQLYAETKYDPGHPAQALRVYTPAHRLYIVTAEGFSSADWTQVNKDDPGAVAVPEGAGRHSLPLTESQLTAVGERIATLG